MSEYIDQDGKRQQLSAIKKYLFIPFAALASFTVGAGTTAITYTTVLALAAKLLPVLAILWPPLPLIIVGILSLAVGITLTVAVLTATVEAIKNSQNVTWGNVKAAINNLSTRQIVGYVFKGLLVLLGLFGLAYFRYTAGLDLFNLMGSITGPLAGAIIAGITGVIAYIPQAFFTVFSIEKLIRFYSPTSDTAQELTPAQPRSLFSRIKSGVSSVYTSICLIGNALGNAALVVVDAVSALSISGAVGCFLNSWSGNLLETDRNQQHRNQATAALAGEIAEFNAETRGGGSASGGMTEHTDALNTVFLPSTTSDVHPQESNRAPIAYKTNSRFRRTQSSDNNETTTSEEKNVTTNYDQNSPYLYKSVKNVSTESNESPDKVAAATCQAVN